MKTLRFKPGVCERKEWFDDETLVKEEEELDDVEDEKDVEESDEDLMNEAKEGNDEWAEYKSASAADIFESAVL
jgi:hypothetical protein